MADRVSKDGKEGKSAEGPGRRGASGEGTVKPDAKAKRAKPAADGEGRAVAAAPTKTGRTSATAKAGARTKQPDLKKDLRDFAAGRPHGWGHEDWLAFLESLSKRGHNIADREAIGLALERERLEIALGGIKGIGPQKRQALAEKYGRIWDLRHADPEEIARVAGVSKSVGERIRSELR